NTSLTAAQITTIETNGAAALLAQQTFTDSHTYADNRPGNAPYTITATVTDANNLSGSATTTATVNNVPPTAAINGAPATSPEGTAISLTSSATDAGSADTAAGLASSWSVTKNGQPFRTGTSLSFDGQNDYAVTPNLQSAFS